MTPVLYKSTEVDFKDNGLGPLTEIYDVDVAEQRNGLFQLTATYPTNGKLYNNMDVGNIILAKPNPTATAHAFRIVVSDLDVFAKNLQIEADSITYDLTHNLIKHVVLDGDGQTAMSQLQRATMNSHLYTFTSDILHSSKSELNMINPMESIAGTQGSFLQIWGGELKRENRKISMLNRRGRDNVTSFRLGKNISGLKYSVDMSSVVTQIIPYVTKSDSESENTQYIYGMIINSKNINNYPSIYLQQVDVSDKITVEETDTDAIITGKINDYAKDWFTKSENTDRDEPKVTVDIDVLSLQDSSDYQDKFKDLEMVELTDTVTVYVPEFNINVTAIVNELHYDPVSERIISLVVGAAKVSFSDANNNTLNDIQNKIDEIHKDANNAAESANGKNTVYWGKDKPLHPVEGDLWYWTDGENEGLKIFKNGEWEDVVDSKTQERIDRAVDDAITEANDYSDDLNKKTNDNFNKTMDNVNGQLNNVQPRIDQAKNEAIAHADGADVIIQKGIDNITEIVMDPTTGLSSTRVQLNSVIQQEIKDRITGDSNTLTQAKDFTTSQIKSYDSGMQTQLTQTANGIIGSVSSLNLVVDSSLINKIELWQTLNGQGDTGQKHFYYSTGVSYKGIQSVGYNQTTLTGQYSFLSSQKILKSSFTSNTIYVSVDARLMKMGGTKTDYFNVYLVEYDKDNKFLNTSVTGQINTADNKWHNYRKKITLKTTTTSIMLMYQMRGNGNSYIARPYVGVNELVEGAYIPGSVSNNSTVLQLFNDNFALGIKNNTGTIISGINGDSSGTVISGKKIVLDGNVAVTADFYAKGGNFKNLNASNMTAGTLNAANVNLINMNASNITTGTIKGANLSINLLNGNVTFQKGRIYSTTGTIDINIDQGYLSVTNVSGTNKNNVLIRNGEIAFTQPEFFDPSKDPYLRITNNMVNSSFGSSTIQARDSIEMNIKGYESSIVNELDTETLSGIKFGIGNSNKLEATRVGGAGVGVIISGGKKTTNKLINNSPYITVGAADHTGLEVGGVGIALMAQHIYMPPAWQDTTSWASNVHIDNNGKLARSTSASKYKQNIIRNVDLNDSEKLLNIPLARWDDKAEVRLTGTSKRYFGMIAEDLAAAGLEYLVDRGPNGEIEGIEYSKVALLLIPEVKKLRNKIEMLEQQNGGNIA